MNASRLVLQSVLERSECGTDGFDCFREGPAHRLQIWGRLPDAWAGNLALHMFVSDLQIVTADAMQAEGGIWAATFLLEASEPSLRVRHDFLKMARRSPRVLPTLPDPLVSVSSPRCCAAFRLSD